MAKIRIYLISFALITSFVLQLSAWEHYPDICFTGINISDIYCEYEYDISSTNKVDNYNKIIDSLLNSKLTMEEEKVLHSFTLVFYNLNQEQITRALDLISNKASVRRIAFVKCSFVDLPVSLNSFNYLERLKFYECDSLRSLGIFTPKSPIFEFYFVGCHLKSLPNGLENVSPFLRLLIHLPNNFQEFNLERELEKFVIKNNITDLAIRGRDLPNFPENIFYLKSLQTLMFESNITFKYPAKFDMLTNLKKLSLTCWDEEVENSARRNSTFMEFRPLEYLDSDVLYVGSYRYCDLNSLNSDTDLYTYWSNSGFKFTTKRKDMLTKEFIYMFGEDSIKIQINFVEKKMYFHLLNNNLSRKFSATLLDYSRIKIGEGIIKDGKIMIDVENLSDFRYYIKLTLGRYSKVIMISPY